MFTINVCKFNVPKSNLRAIKAPGLYFRNQESGVHLVLQSSSDRNPNYSKIPKIENYPVTIPRNPKKIKEHKRQALEKETLIWILRNQRFEEKTISKE